jgi:hypothetical protein
MTGLIACDRDARLPLDEQHAMVQESLFSYFIDSVQHAPGVQQYCLSADHQSLRLVLAPALLDRLASSQRRVVPYAACDTSLSELGLYARATHINVHYDLDRASSGRLVADVRLWSGPESATGWECTLYRRGRWALRRCEATWIS